MPLEYHAAVIADYYANQMQLSLLLFCENIRNECDEIDLHGCFDIKRF